jgi:hypothetical protein
MDGYGIDVECDEQSLRVQAKNNAARVALTGKAQGDGALVIPLATIYIVKFRAASMFVKGKVSVGTTDGHKYRMSFRKRQQGDFERLAQQLDAVLWQRFHDVATSPTTSSQSLDDRTSRQQGSVSDMPSQDEPIDRDHELG